MKSVIFVAWCVAAVAQAKSASELTASGNPEEQARAIVAELAARNVGFKDLVGEVDMVLSDGQGSEAHRRFSLKVLERINASEGDRSLIVFESPADVKGTAVLSHSGGAGAEDEQWLFVPSSRRTRRISASNRGGSFVGSEFTFEDLTGNDSRKYRWSLIGARPCGESSCFQVEATPLDPTSAYAKRVLWVDQADLRVLKVEFFDRKVQLLKTLAYDDFQTLNEKYRRAQRWTMKNVQTGKSTIIRFTGMKLSTGLAASDFSPNVLSR